MQYETVAFQTSCTGAHEDHICSATREGGVFPACQVTVTGVGGAFRETWRTRDKNCWFCLMILYFFYLYFIYWKNKKST